MSEEAKRRKWLIWSIGLLVLLGADASVSLVRETFQSETFEWRRAVLPIMWFSLALGQWFTRGGWRLPIVIIALVWLAIALWTYYLALTGLSPGSKLVLTAAIHSWLLGIVVPGILVSVNLRLLFRAKSGKSG